MLYLTEEVPAMPVNEFLVLWLSSWAAIAFFRIAPAFALRGRTLSPRITEALGYIPPAAFAALVANDLVSPGAFDAGLWPALVPWIAAVGVVVVAVKTKSMLWCCVSGIVLYTCLEPYIGVASRAPNLVPSQLVEFFTELVYFFWYHGQTLL